MVHETVEEPLDGEEGSGKRAGGDTPEDETRQRGFVETQEELLEKANEAAGGDLDDLKEVKPGWWQGERPDGTTVRIEWEPSGHRSTNEGPHVTVRIPRDPADPTSGWRVVDKIFVRGRETYR